jgi:hypothetical protein
MRYGVSSDEIISQLGGQSPELLFGWLTGQRGGACGARPPAEPCEPGSWGPPSVGRLNAPFRWHLPES